jgi:dipeptidyl aminopeptidase/acylaminoacyl peptidase
MAPRVASYGTWPSPLDAATAAGLTLTLSEVWRDRDAWYWLEGRPQEGGRQVIVRLGADGVISDVNPAPWNARTRVHEYGGGAYTVVDGVAFFSHFGDMRVYRLEVAGGDAGRQVAPHPITPPGANRFADFTADRTRNRLIAVNEDHTNPQTPPGGNYPEPTNRLAAFAMQPGPGEPRLQILAEGADFYSNPRVSRDGARLAWIQWRHPHMPWDDSELWVGRFDEAGGIVDPRRIAGGSGTSVTQPEWSPAGELVFGWDRTGFWELHRWAPGDRPAEAEMGAVARVTDAGADFGRAHWTFGTTPFGFLSDGSVIAAARRRGSDTLVRVDLATGAAGEWDASYPQIDDLVVGEREVALVAGNPRQPVSIVTMDLATKAQRVVRRAAEFVLEPAYVSEPRAIEFPTADGGTGYALLYEPRNGDVTGPPEERPPLLVRAHGGPVGSSFRSLSLSIQYFTTRGFAVLDVDYAGTTGYGRAYRERLHGTWGVADLDDCVAAAQSLVDAGVVDPARTAIRGGSAGGYTTLCALTFRTFFEAGTSLYGIADLSRLAVDSHKFEAHSMDWLVGPYPEEEATYRARSPLYAAERIERPLLILQGLDDRVVPPNQAEAIIGALKARGIPHAYVPFEGEDHGFRKAENLKRALEAELTFYAEVFGIGLADALPPLGIGNAARTPTG